MSDDARLAQWLGSHRARVAGGSSTAHIDVDTLTRHATGQLSPLKAAAVSEHLLVCEDARCVAFVRAQSADSDAAASFLYPRREDDDAMRARTFHCRDTTWTLFEEAARERGVPVDELVNDAMLQYARSRGYHEGPDEARRDRPDAVLEETQDAPAAMRALSSLQTARFREPPPLESDELSESEPLGRAPMSISPPTMRPLAPTPEAVIRAPGSARVLSAKPSPPSRPLPMPLPVPGRSAPAATPPPFAQRAPLPAPAPLPRAGAAPPAPGHAPPPARPSRAAPPPLPSSPRATAAPLAAPTAKRLVLTYQGRSYEVDKETFLIGRSKTAADLRIDDNNVSRQHAMIERVGSVYYLVDLGSTNGVFVFDDRVTRRALADGDVIVVTAHEIRVSLR